MKNMSIENQIKVAKERLIEADFNAYEFSLFDEMPDSLNISHSTGNDFLVYYIDDRGARHNVKAFPLISLCVEYLIEIKNY